jgi:hypothetical protein
MTREASTASPTATRLQIAWITASRAPGLANPGACPFSKARRQTARITGALGARLTPSVRRGVLGTITERARTV